MNKLILGSDHAGFALREILADHAEDLGYQVEIVGALSQSPYDYPDAVDELVPKLLRGDAGFGVLVCGSGIGMSIRANRYEGIRAANCCSPVMAELARQHNHANVLCVGERTTDPEIAKAVLDAFLLTPEDHADRHDRRVEKLDNPLVR